MGLEIRQYPGHFRIVVQFEMFFALALRAASRRLVMYIISEMINGFGNDSYCPLRFAFQILGYFLQLQSSISIKAKTVYFLVFRSQIAISLNIFEE